MSNLNNYAFANKLEQFNQRVLQPHKEKVARAEAIMHDPNYKWESEEKRKTAQAQYDSYKAWLVFYQTHYDEGVKFTSQHEQLANSLSKWYDLWYKNISNEGRQETEMMKMQADMLQEIFTEMYTELKSLNLPDVKQPQALNLK